MDRMRPAVLCGVVVVALAGYLGYYGIYLPDQRKLSTLREQLTKEQETQELAGGLVHSLEEVEQLRKRLPQAPETERLLQEVGRIAQQEGVQLISIVPQEPKGLQDVTRLAVTLKFVSSYHQLGRFVSGLENAPLFLLVETLNLSRDREDVAHVEMTVSTVYVPPLTSAVEGDNRVGAMPADG